MNIMFSKLFYKKVRSSLPNIPPNPTQWPKAWSMIFFKEYPRFDAVSLPREMLPLKNLKEVLFERRSTRECDASQSISLEELSTLLYYSAGIKCEPGEYTESNQEERNSTRRFYPSGGARYPLEMYVDVRRVSGVEPGVYHYNLLNHSLEKLLSKDAEENTIAASVLASWTKDSAVVFIITGVQGRNAIKYGDFGYDMLATESGHMSQNLHLLGASLGMKYCPLFGFNNEEIHKTLDAREDELILYVTAMGK
ncbi:MAG: SagB/ThcOx family dehydrogenase [Candidatus Pacebacteria bacterium]|nr:SagB/ThcOx family dehydrogenase [Candidatus Paceibacterota bacterium]